MIAISFKASNYTHDRHFCSILYIKYILRCGYKPWYVTTNDHQCSILSTALKIIASYLKYVKSGKKFPCNDELRRDFSSLLESGRVTRREFDDNRLDKVNNEKVLPINMNTILSSNGSRYCQLTRVQS